MYDQDPVEFAQRIHNFLEKHFCVDEEKKQIDEELQFLEKQGTEESTPSSPSFEPHDQQEEKKDEEVKQEETATEDYEQQ